MGIVDCRDYERSAWIHEQEDTKTYIERPELLHAGIDSSARIEVSGTSRSVDWPHPSACGNEWDERCLGLPRASRGKCHSPKDELHRARPGYRVQGCYSCLQPIQEKGKSEYDDASPRRRL